MSALAIGIAVEALGLVAWSVYVPRRMAWLKRNNRPKVLAGVGHAHYAVNVLFWSAGAVQLTARGNGGDLGTWALIQLFCAGAMIGMVATAAWTWREAMRRGLIP